MKNYNYAFRGWGVHPSNVIVHILKNVNGETWVGFEDIDDGTSVTNASEQLAKEIVQKENLNAPECRFFEWYSQYEGDVDEITYIWLLEKTRGGSTLSWNAHSPHWKPFCSSAKNPFKQ